MPRGHRRGALRHADAQPQRLCVVCRTSHDANTLVQLKFAEVTGHGRGAYVCIARACLEQVHSKLLARALKGPVEALDGAAVQRAVHAMAEGRLAALLGLARRSGHLVFGVDAVAQASQDCDEGDERGIWWRATDLAPRSARKLQATQAFLSSGTLGAAVGMGSVGALGIVPGRLAKQAAYWFRVWYETQSREQLAETLSQAASGYQQHGSGQGTPTRD